MQTEQLHDDRYLRILWGAKTRIIGIEWKETTSTMTSEEFTRRHSKLAPSTAFNKPKIG